MKLRNFLRFHPESAQRFVPLSAFRAGHRDLDPETDSFFSDVTDRVTHDLLQEMKREARSDSYLATFVRGSFVQSRLELCRWIWERCLRVLGHEDLLEDLRRIHGAMAVDEAIQRMESIACSTILGGENEGASKLVLRLSELPKSYLSHSYPEVSGWIQKIFQHGGTLNSRMKDLFASADLGEALPIVRSTFQESMEASGERETGAKVLEHFDDFIRIQFEAGCLHPLLPMRDEVTRKIGIELGLSAVETRTTLDLFRFSWLSRNQGSRGYSDFSLKCMIVLEQERGGANRSLLDADLAKLFSTAERTFEVHPALRILHGSFPRVRLEVAAYVISLPSPLYRCFKGMEEDRDRWVFLCRLYMGEEYLRDWVRERGGLAEPDTATRAALTGESQRWKDLYDQAVVLRWKRSDHESIKVVEPRGILPSRARRVLEKAIASGKEEAMRKYCRLAVKVSKYDYTNNVRGIWTFHPTSPNSS